MKNRKLLLLLGLVVCMSLMVCAAGAAEELEAAHHRSECAEHWASCDDPTTCYVCGATDVNIYVVMHGGNSVYAHDATYHWWICDACDGTFEGEEKEEHYGRCDDPTTCYDCGATDINICGVTHVGSSAFAHDTTHHWWVCDACNGVLERDGKSEHYGYCDDPTTCAYCEATAITCGEDNLWHNGDSVIVHDATHHWSVCNACGKSHSVEEHFSFCYAPATCSGCKATDVTITAINRNHSGNYDYAYDATHHWKVCDACNGMYEYYGKKEHRSNCDSPDICRDCKAADVTVAADNLRHIGDAVYVHDATHHWRICDVCNSMLEWSTPTRHVGYCNDLTTCMHCNATDVTIAEDKLFHCGYSYAYDATHHWEVCNGCGETFWKSEHYARCTDLTTCLTCAASGITAPEKDAYHQDQTTYHDDTYHWLVCDDCGKISLMYEHHAVCTDPDYCWDCYTEGIIPGVLEHDYTYTWDEHYHYATCIDCGNTEKDIHFAYCEAPNVCWLCGGGDITTEWLSHDMELSSTDATQHYYTCTGCGDTDSGKHYAYCDEPDTCWNCDATGVTMESVYHSYKVTSTDAGKHYYACRRCGETGAEQHYGYCDETTCYGCGHENVTFAEEDTYHRDVTWAAVAEGCKSQCTLCGVYDIDPHEYKDGVCIYCGHKEDAAPARTPGDASGDGAVNTTDALLILQYMSGGASINASNADCNGDGAVNTMDALLILQYMSGWGVTLK